MAKIFVLEDDKDIREVVELILESEGYEVVSFDSIGDFMKRGISEVPELYLLDVMLPDGSGIEICNQLRQNPEYHNIPILIMSAHASLEQVSNNCVASGFIKKPFEMGQFLKTIHHQLNLES